MVGADYIFISSKLVSELCEPNVIRERQAIRHHHFHTIIQPRLRTMTTAWRHSTVALCHFTCDYNVLKLTIITNEKEAVEVEEKGQRPQMGFMILF